MSPVIIAAADHQPRLVPDDLRPDGKARARQTLGHRRGVQRPVPDVCDIPGEQRPGLAPVGAVVVHHSAHRGASAVQLQLLAPAWIVVHPVRRVGHHQVRHHAGEYPRDRVGVRAVTADQPVSAQHPHVARRADRVCWQFGRVIWVSQPCIGVTETKLTPLASNTSTILAKSISDRVSRSTL